MKHLGTLLVLLSLLIVRVGNTNGQGDDEYPLITPENAAQVTQLARLGNGRITAAAWSADAQTLVVATALDIYIYRAGVDTPQIIADTGLIADWEFEISDDGRFLATTQLFPTPQFRAWNLETGEEISLTDSELRLKPAQFLPGSALLLTQSAEGVHVWNLETNELIRQMPVYYSSLTITPDLKHVIGFNSWMQNGSGREFFDIYHWDGITGESLQFPALHAEGNWPVDYAFNPAQPAMLGVVDQDGIVRLWDVASKGPLYALTLPYDLVTTIAFSLDGYLLATDGTDGKVRVWESATGALLDVFPGQPEDVQRLSFDHAGRLIAFGGDQHEARAWDVRTLETITTFAFPADTQPSFHAAAFNASGDQVIASGADGTVHFWDALSGQEQAVWQGVSPDTQDPMLAEINGGRNAAFSQERRYLVVLDQQQGELYLWDLDQDTEPVTLKMPIDEWGVDPRFSFDNRWLVFNGWTDVTPPLENYNLWLWHFDEHMNLLAETVLVPDYMQYYPNIAFSPTEPVIGYVDNPDQPAEHYLYLRDVETGSVRSLAQVEEGVKALVFSPDGNVLALRRADTLEIWKVHTGTLDYEFGVCELPPTNKLALEFSPKGALILTSCTIDVALYDTRSGENLNTLTGHTAHIESAAFNAAGTQIVTTGLDGTVRLWGIQ